MDGIKQRRSIADYINVSKDGAVEKWALMGTGFTDLNDNPSAQTSDKKYINMKSKTKRIAGYDWSAPYTTDQIRQEEAVEFICNIGEHELTGPDAETDYVKVDLDKKVGDSGTEYEARKRRVAIEVAEFSNNDGEMQASGNLLAVEDWIFGKFDVTAKAFTAEV